MSSSDAHPRPAEHRIDTGGLAFRVLASHAERVTGPAIVLVHGIGMSHRYLARVHDVLAEHRTVFSLDLPGFGGLPKPAHDVDVRAMAAGVVRVLEGLDAGPVVLVGHSMGAQWVTEVAATRPDLVASVALIGPVADVRFRTPFAQARALAVDTLKESPRVNAIVFTDYVRCGIPWYLAQLRHMLAYPIEQRLGAVSVPVLLVRGARDPIAGPEWCRMLRESAPTAALAEVPGSAHVVQESAPREVATLLLAHARARADRA